MSDATLFVEQFHWLRPLWLLALLPAILLAWMIWRQTLSARQWSSLIAPEFLTYLVDGQTNRKRRWILWGLLLIWTLACLALAGPSWEQRPMPVHANNDALVIVLDLSPSMIAEDVTPSRLTRARMKIADILRERREGFTGLVAYAGSAHVVTPLTDDTSTISNLVPALHPDMMPLPGSNTEEALERAIELLEQGGVSGGRVLFVTDGVAESATSNLMDQLENVSVQLSILGVGTADGAPIPNSRGGFERDRQGNMVVARLDEERLQHIAHQGGGRYHRLSRSSDDIDWLLGQPSLALEAHRQLEREFDTWHDRGHWLVLLLLPLVLYAFRPGLLLALVCLPLLAVTPQPSHAQGLDAVWLNPDQRGQKLLQNEQPEEAARIFDNPEWRGSALYRAGEYEAAAQAFAQNDNARSNYNRGNALARAGELEEALEAYDRALEQHPGMEDAQANRDLVEELLNQQQEQQGQDQDQDQQNQSEDGDDQEGDPQDSQDPSDQDQQGEQDPADGDQGSQDPQDESARDDDESRPEDGEQEQQNDQAGEENEPGEPQDQSPEDAGPEEDAEQEAAVPEESDLSDEEKQALEQWLRRVPDNPSGLLRRKFEHQSQLQQRERLRRQSGPQDTEERW